MLLIDKPPLTAVSTCYIYVQAYSLVFFKPRDGTYAFFFFIACEGNPHVHFPHRMSALQGKKEEGLKQTKPLSGSC